MLVLIYNTARISQLFGLPYPHTREDKYAKNHFQQNRYSVFESHVMRKIGISTKILLLCGRCVVVQGIVGYAGPPLVRFGLDAAPGFLYFFQRMY